jgi:hypothetical protein
MGARARFRAVTYYDTLGGLRMSGDYPRAV